MNETRQQALDKLDREYRDGKYDNRGAVMKEAVRDALKEFIRQDEEFAQAVAQGGAFDKCMKAVAKNCGSALSDLEAYKRAVRFYFPGADVAFQMRVVVNPAEDSGEITLNLADFF